MDYAWEFVRVQITSSDMTVGMPEPANDCDFEQGIEATDLLVSRCRDFVRIETGEGHWYCARTERILNGLVAPMIIFL
jgi:hypothetical protein